MFEKLACTAKKLQKITQKINIPLAKVLKKKALQQLKERWGAKGLFFL
jgi:hypothetical protein